jgi:hypothetical protein
MFGKERVTGRLKEDPGGQRVVRKVVESDRIGGRNG